MPKQLIKLSQNPTLWHSDPVRVLRFRLHRMAISETTRIPDELGGGLIRRTYDKLEDNTDRQVFIVTTPDDQYTLRISGGRGATYAHAVDKLIQKITTKGKPK